MEYSKNNYNGIHGNNSTNNQVQMIDKNVNEDKIHSTEIYNNNKDKSDYNQENSQYADINKFDYSRGTYHKH